VSRDRGRAPRIKLHGRALSRAEKLKIKEISISISHARDYAVAFVMGETE